MRMSSMFGITAAALVIVLAASACGGESKLGEECDERGGTEDVCESGSVCGTNTGTALVCIKTCTEQAQCADTEECNGVEGTNVKGCRLKSGSDATTNADAGKK